MSRLVMGMVILVLFGVQDLSAAEVDQTTKNLYSGNALFNRKIYALAITEYDRFLKSQPQHVKKDEAIHGLALCYYLSRRYKEAEPKLRAALQGKVGDKVQLRMMLGQTLMKLKRSTDAEKEFKTVLSQKTASSFHAQALSYLGSLTYADKRYPETIATAERLLGMASVSKSLIIRARYDGGVSAYQTGDYKKTVTFLEPLPALVADNESLHARVLYLLAEGYRQSGVLDKAVATYTAALKGIADASVSEVQYRIGYVHFELKDWNAALSAFQACLKASDKGGVFARDAKLFAGRCYLELGNHQRASQSFGQLVRVVKPDAEALLWLGRTHSRRKDYKGAAMVLSEFSPKCTRDALYLDILYDLANAFMATDQYSKASKQLVTVLRKRDWGQWLEAARLNAVCMHRLENYKESVRWTDEFLKAGKDSPHRPDMLFMRAENLYMQKQNAEATRAYSDFLSSSASHAARDAAIFRQVQILHREGKLSEAVKAAGTLVKKDSKDAVFSQLFFVLGDCEFRQGNWMPAVVNHERFLDAYSKSAKRRKKGKHRGGKSQEPNLDTAMIQSAISHLNLKDSASALISFQDVYAFRSGLNKESIHTAMALSELGRLCYEANDLRRASVYLQAYMNTPAHVKQPQLPQVQYYLAWIRKDESAARRNEGKLDEAEKLFSQVAAAQSGKHVLSADAAFQQGALQLERKKYADASRTLNSVVSRYPEYANFDVAAYSLGMALVRQKQHGRAAPYFQKVVESYPKSSVADRSLYEWAWCAKAGKQKKEAEARYKKLLSAYPKSSLIETVRAELAELTFTGDSKEKYDEVIAILEKTLIDVKSQALKETTMYRLAGAYFNKKNYGKAAVTFEKQIAEFPASKHLASSLFQAGESRMRLSETILAREHFKRAKAIKGTGALSENILMRLGETQSATEEWPAARATYKEFITTFPKSKWVNRAMFGEAYALENSGQHSQAIGLYKKFVGLGKKDDQSARAQYRIGECYSALQKYDDAIQAYVKVTVTYPHPDLKARAMLGMGLSFKYQGKPDLAKARFKELLMKQPDTRAAVVARKELNKMSGK